MTEFNADEIFKPFLAKINNSEIKTTHHLRIDLESLSEKLNINTLKLLVSFREWLLNKNLELSTANGVVTLEAH